MTLTPCPPLSSPPSSPGCHLSANLSRCIANPTRSFIILFFTLLFFFPPPPLFPLSGGGLGVAGLYFPTGFARAGPVAGFQGDTLLLAFSDLRQVGLCLPRGPLSFIFSFCVFFFFIFLFTPLSFFSASSSSPPLPCPFHPSPILPHTPLNPPHLHPSFGFLILFLLRFLFFFFVIPHPSRPCFLHPFVYLLCLSGSF